MTTRRRHKYQPGEDGRVNVMGRRHIYQLDDDGLVNVTGRRHRYQPDEDGWVNVTGRRHRYQPDEDSRDDPNERGTFQDNWQSDEDISALDGRAI